MQLGQPSFSKGESEDTNKLLLPEESLKNRNLNAGGHSQNENANCLVRVIPSSDIWSGYETAKAGVSFHFCIRL